MQYTSKYTCKLGEILLASDGENLTGLWFIGQKYFAQNLEKENCEKDFPIFEKTKMWLDIYFSGKMPTFTPTLSINASAFKKQVLEILLLVPYGQTTTYGEIAKQVASKTNKKVSAQAVGGAIGHNPISIIIPCHRVVGSSKSLTGYAGGIDKKLALLKLENIDTTNFTLPQAKK